ncbi:DUF885 domain-containing protein [Sphingorhabdus soli]|uniref:DUF885 domain-containing protein n=1 Tax=Flavisphingopyxis soli TaxID=2601267 RepID=A0A5C6UP16_9SPHN|nr:DUF885 domain-containing protein [Sphingorhabdus soli]
MTLLRSTSILALMLPLAACATTEPMAGTGVAAQTSTAVTAAQSAQSEHDRMFAIFAADDEANLKRNPMSALFRGDLRYADRLGDFYTDAYNDAERSAAQDNLKQLATIDRAKLDPTDKIVYDVYKYNQDEALKGLTPEILALTDVRPINHFFGLHTFYPTFASGKGAAPFKTLVDYDNSLKRNADFVRIVDRSIARFKQGEASGVVETKLTIRNVIDQLDTQLKMPVEESPYWGPMTQFPDDFSAADKARLTAAYRASITNDIYPALTRLRDFLRDEYLAQAREGVGLKYMKGGPELYKQLIESTTTLPLTADYIHNLGLSEVKRITGEMEKIQAEVGYKGTLKQFFQALRDDPKLQPKTRDELTQDYYRIGKVVEAKIPTYFSLVPKAGLEIRPYPEFREKFEAGGSYEPGTPDGSRPGVFYFNAYDLPSRNVMGNTTLFLHEGEPGHHFQISLAQENEALPAFMRFGGNTAYVEGWALYSETLGYPMGLYKDPYQHMGTLSDEMLRAMRLVVDTGIHADGWTRDQAIQYMIDNSPMGKTDATAEVERYIAIPSQALAYKIGALSILRLKDKAQKALGAKFDIRDFHAQILGTGALPLPVLEKKVDDWIAAGGGA